MKINYKMIAMALAVLIPSFAHAGALSLKSIMQQLGKDFSSLNHAVLMEDFDSIQEYSLKIADHPKPGMMERLSVLAKVGSDSGRFKAIDGEVHDAAMQIHEAAKEEDITAVMSAKTRLFNGCMQCHTAFRKTLTSSSN